MAISGAALAVEAARAIPANLKNMAVVMDVVWALVFLVVIMPVDVSTRMTIKDSFKITVNETANK
jgi:hypothetical protein